MKIPTDIKFVPASLAYIFGLNFVWEISQMFLYKNHTTDFVNFIQVHIKASLGDVVLFIIIYLAGVILFKNYKWFFEETISTYLFTAICGFIIAVLVEKYALSTGRWEYNNLMPVIPILEVGLSPILQLIILPILYKKSLKK